MFFLQDLHSLRHACSSFMQKVCRRMLAVKIETVKVHLFLPFIISLFPMAKLRSKILMNFSTLYFLTTIIFSDISLQGRTVERRKNRLNPPQDIYRSSLISTKIRSSIFRDLYLQIKNSCSKASTSRFY